MTLRQFVPWQLVSDNWLPRELVPGSLINLTQPNRVIWSFVLYVLSRGLAPPDPPVGCNQMGRIVTGWVDVVSIKFLLNVSRFNRQAAYSQLIFAGKRDHDPVAAVAGEPRLYLAQSLHKLSTSNPGSVAPLIAQLQPVVQGHVQKYLQQANLAI